MADFRRTRTRGLFSHDVPTSHSSALESLSSPAGYAFSIFTGRSRDNDRVPVGQVLARSPGALATPTSLFAGCGVRARAVSVDFEPPTLNSNCDVLPFAECKTIAREKSSVLASVAVARVGANAAPRRSEMSRGDKSHLPSPVHAAGAGKRSCAFALALRSARPVT